MHKLNATVEYYNEVLHDISFTCYISATSTIFNLRKEMNADLRQRKKLKFGLFITNSGFVCFLKLKHKPLMRMP